MGAGAPGERSSVAQSWVAEALGSRLAMQAGPQAPSSVRPAPNNRRPVKRETAAIKALLLRSSQSFQRPKVVRARSPRLRYRATGMATGMLARVA